jgi:basic amino acid/polyamine antiporter, APA family
MLLISMRFFNRKSLSVFKSLNQSQTSGGLKKTLGPTDLIFLGLGGIIGSGIFVITGLAAARYAGPGVTLSFALGAIACIFTALAFSELAAFLPAAGGAYTYASLTYGEGLGFIVGWCAILCNLFGASTVAAGWSGYFLGTLETIGVSLPFEWTHIPANGGFVNLPAMVIVIVMSLFLVKGTEAAAKLNGILVITKLVAIGIFLVLATPHFDLKHWENFTPMGMSGVLAGAGFVFMAYTGFETVATAAEECKNPNRDLPIGIIGSLVISAVLYMLVSGVMTGIMPFSELENAEPLAYALRKNGVATGGALVALGAMAAMTTVILSQIFGFSRVLLMMARDRSAPKIFAEVHPRYGTPQAGLILGTLVTCALAGFVPIQALGQLGSVCILTVFSFVSLSVMILRKRYPNERRPFQCPAVFVVGTLSVLMCVGLAIPLILQFWLPFGLALLLGLISYFTTRH